MQLRPHQQKAVEMLRDSLRKGKKRPILAAPCSFGKTITAAYMLSEAVKKGKRGFFFCDRVKLVQQALEVFDAQGLDVGVMQGQHQRTDYGASIQIASIQTVARRPNIPQFDFAVVDECHVHYKSMQKIMDRYTAVPFIGLSATPYAKGLGLAYDQLIVPITPSELLDKGYLAPVEYFGGKAVDVSKVGGRALKTGGSDYDPLQLAEATEKDLTLTGDIIKNWIKYAEGRQTIAFSPSIKHSRDMVAQFNEAGISAVHIDGYMDDEERQVIYRAHDRGEFLILSCSRLLNVGYDAPKVSCLIDCFPTRSLITYVQRAGRIMRTAEGKEKAIYLDHAGNVNRHGFAEYIVPDSLDMDDKRFSERSQAKKEKASNPINCPDCYRQFYGMRCVCGYTLPFKERIKTDGSELKKLERKAKKQIDRGQWLAELSLYAYYQGYKPGWAAHIYRQKFGSWPNRVTPPKVNDISPEVMGFIKHCQIRRSHAR